MFSVLREECHVGYSREFVGTVYCTYGQSNTTIALANGDPAQLMHICVIRPQEIMQKFHCEGIRIMCLVYYSCDIYVYDPMIIHVGLPLTFNGAPGNIRSSLAGMPYVCMALYLKIECI